MVEQTTTSEETVVEAENSAPEAVVEEQNSQQIIFDDILNYVDEDIRESKTLNAFKGKPLAEVLPQVVKNYVHAQSLTGKKLANFSESEIREFIGLPVKPSSAEEYKTIEDADMELVDKFKEVMYDIGLDSSQAKKFVELQKKLMDSSSTAAAEAKQKMAEDAEDALHDKFGLQFRKAMDLAKQAALTIGGDDMVEKVFNADVKDPQLIEMLYKVGKELGAGNIVSKELPQKMASDPKAERTKLLADPEFKEAYLNNSNPGHREAVKRMQALYELG